MENRNFKYVYLRAMFLFIENEAEWQTVSFTDKSHEKKPQVDLVICGLGIGVLPICRPILILLDKKFNNFFI